MSKIAIVNSSTLLSNTNGQIITSAMNMILPQFCKDWNLPTFTAVYVPRGQTSTIPYKIFLLDSSDVQNALGYHDLSSGVPYGKAFVNTVLQNGGVLLYSSDPTVPTFAQTVCHEVFELLIDPNVNTWWDIGDSQTLFAAEVSDPVECNPVTVTVVSKNQTYNPLTHSATTTSTKVGLSDWILPAWTNPQARSGPFNHNRTLTAPFTLDSGGYAIVMTSSDVGYTYGMKFGSKVAEAKRAKLSSNIKR